MQQDVIDYSDLELFLRNTPNEAERRNFLNIAPIYPFTTENLSGYLPLLDIPGKSVLTISGSGDHVLNSIFHGARKIDAFDINILSRTFTELKLKALEHLSYQDFLRYFILTPDNGDILSKEIYATFSEYLSLAARNVFDRLYANQSGNGHDLRNSHVFYNQPPVDHNAKYYNDYLKSGENYLITRNNLSDTVYRWFHCNVTDLVKLPVSAGIYDIIMLSNIADYAARMYPGPDHLADFFRNIVLPLKKFLKKGGIICAACIFKVDQIPPEHSENDLYKPDRRIEISAGLGLRYRELRVPGAVKGYDDGLIIIE